MSITRPQSLGGGIAASDSDSLADLSIVGLPIGTRAWNEDVGAFFRLKRCAQTSITIDPDDGYDSPQWSFANATFTGFEGCTLQVVLRSPNGGFSADYQIDTVDDATTVTVVDPPDGTTEAPISGSVVLFEDAEETDVTIRVNGVVGVVWQIEVSGGLQSLSGDFVDNTDPDNPVLDATDAVTNAMLAEMATHTFKGNITGGTANPTDITRTELTAELNPATALLQGAMPNTDKAGQPFVGTLLTGGDQTIQPGTDKCGKYILPAGAQIANAVLIVGHTDAVGSGMTVDIVIEDTSAFTYIMKAGDGSTVIGQKIVSAGKAQTWRFYFSTGGGQFGTNVMFWSY